MFWVQKANMEAGNEIQTPKLVGDIVVAFCLCVKHLECYVF